VLGREPIIEAEYASSRGPREVRGDGSVRCGRAGHKAAAVDVERRSRLGAGRVEPLSTNVRPGRTVVTNGLDSQSTRPDPAKRPRRAEHAARAARQAERVAPVAPANARAHGQAKTTRLPTGHDQCLGVPAFGPRQRRSRKPQRGTAWQYSTYGAPKARARRGSS